MRLGTAGFNIRVRVRLITPSEGGLFFSSEAAWNIFRVPCSHAGIYKTGATQGRVCFNERQRREEGSQVGQLVTSRQKGRRNNELMLCLQDINYSLNGFRANCRAAPGYRIDRVYGKNPFSIGALNEAGPLRTQSAVSPRTC